MSEDYWSEPKRAHLLNWGQAPVFIGSCPSRRGLLMISPPPSWTTGPMECCRVALCRDERGILPHLSHLCPIRLAPRLLNRDSWVRLHLLPQSLTAVHKLSRRLRLTEVTMSVRSSVSKRRLHSHPNQLPILICLPPI